MASIIYLHQYFRLPSERGPWRSYMIAEDLVKQGFDVTVVTSHNGHEVIHRTVNGIKIIYLPISYKQSMSYPQRIIAFGSFALSAIGQLHRLRHAKVLLATSTPLTVGIVGWWWKKAYRKFFMFEVRDLWPDAPIALGAVKGKVYKKLLYALEQSIYTSADQLIALSPSIAEHIRLKSPSKPVLTLPNFSDCSIFTPKEKTSQKLCIAYTGSFGKANDPQFLKSFATTLLLEFGDRVRLRFAGSGTYFDEVKDALLPWSGQVTFQENLDQVQTAELLAMADIALVSFLPLPVMETGSPNKVFDGLASGCAIAMNTKGWLWQEIEQAQAGIYLHPSDKNQWKAQFMRLLDNPLELQQMKQKARLLAEEKFSKNSAVKIFSESAKKWL